MLHNGKPTGNTNTGAGVKIISGGFPASNHTGQPLDGAHASTSRTDFGENLLRMAERWKVAGCAVHAAKADGS